MTQSYCTCCFDTATRSFINYQYSKRKLKVEKILIKYDVSLNYKYWKIIQRYISTCTYQIFIGPLAPTVLICKSFRIHTMYFDKCLISNSSHNDYKVASIHEASAVDSDSQQKVVNQLQTTS